ICDLYPLRALRNLEREWRIRDSRDTRLEAVCNGILRAVLVILLPLRQCRGEIRDLAIRRIYDSSLASMDSPRCGVRFNIPIERKIEDLPDACQIWFPVGHAGNRIGRGDRPASRSRSLAAHR